MSDEQANLIAAAAAARLLAPPASMSDEQVTGSGVAAARPEGVPDDALALSETVLNLPGLHATHVPVAEEFPSISPSYPAWH